MEKSKVFHSVFVYLEHGRYSPFVGPFCRIERAQNKSSYSLLLPHGNGIFS